MSSRDRTRSDAPRIDRGQRRLRGGPPCLSTTTSSSSAPARAAARSRTRSRRPASGSCCSSAATSCRGRWRTGTPSRVHRRALHLDGHLVRRRRQGVPAAGALLRRRRDEAVRRGAVPAAPAGLRRAASTSTASRPRGRFAYDDFEPCYTKAEWLYQVHGNHGEDPTEGPWSKQYPWPAVSHEPRIQQLFDDLDGGGLPTVPRAVRRSCSTRPTGRGAPASAARGATATRASCTPSPTPRRSRSVRLLEHDNVTLLVERRGRAARDRRRRARGDRRRGRTRRRAPRPTRPTSSFCRRARRTPPRSCCMSANDRHPNGLANGSDQVGRNYMFHNSKAVVALSKEPNDTVFQKTLGLNDFYFGADGLRLSRSATSRWSASRNAEAMKGEEPELTKLAPHWTLDETARHAVDFWLTTEDLPQPDNRVTRRRRRQHQPRLHVDQRRGGRPPLPRAQEDPEPRRDGRASRARQELLHAHEHPGRRGARTRPARAGSAPTRRPRCSTRTARPTSSTTSTSSTRASSRASAR